MATRYWVGVDNPGWDNVNTANWSTSSGGSGGASCPTSADDVIFDTGGTGERICTVTADVACKTLTQLAGAPSFVIGATPFTVTIHEGGFAGLGVVNLGWIKFVATSGTHTVSNINGNVEFAGVGGTWNCTGSGNSFNTLLLTGGTVNFPSGQAYQVGMLRSTGTDARVLNLSSTDVVFKQSLTFTTPVDFSGSNFTFTKGTGNMRFSDSIPVTMARAFNGAGKAFNALDLTYARSDVSNKFTITGSNSFSDLTIGSGQYVEFDAGTTQTLSGTFTAVGGGSGDTITLKSDSGGSQATLSAPTSVVDYVNVQDSIATGGATWAPINNTNLGNNTGWELSGTSGRQMLLFFAHS